MNAPFTGGEKLEAYLAKTAEKVRNPGTLRVGFLGGAAYDDGTPVALVAAIQEFGAPSRNIPPRPFFRRMIAKEKGHWGSDVATLLKAHANDAAKCLRLMGEEIGGELQESIRGLSDPPLQPATIKAKGFDKPLVDTGHMLASVAWEVEA